MPGIRERYGYAYLMARWAWTPTGCVGIRTRTPSPEKFQENVRVPLPAWPSCLPPDPLATRSRTDSFAFGSAAVGGAVGAVATTASGELKQLVESSREWGGRCESQCVSRDWRPFCRSPHQ